MNYKIICFGDKIKLKDSSPALSFLDDSSNHYYRIDNNIIEVINLYNFEDYNFNLYKGKIIVLINKITSNNVSKIKNLIKKSNVLIFAGENLTEENLKSTIFISGLKNHEEIELKLLIKIISNEEFLYKVKNMNYINYIIMGQEENTDSIGGMILNILKNLSFLSGSKNYNVIIYSKNELNLQDLGYLEDAIKEYIEINSKLIFDQITTLNENDNLNYFIIGEKILK
ncbi:hypothetical protein [Clostridium weizhouense]|uniref:Cell division protein FtsZ C-terminal domain-containing protein n=1 Tax=Clostridium weizhouense TaxID=2859781 RepID=A0ABS7AU62_9CLOT|nr:hypothetical protein [Clostridium weizhouense]MBW6411748.1 hypothetical protein [Clostridium weizhouense]